MTRTRKTQTPTKGPAQTIFEYFLLAICLFIVALRTTYTEGPNPQSSTQPINLGDNLYTLTLSTILILTFAAWLIVRLLSPKPLSRPNILVPGVLLFILAAIVSGTAASNARAAITDSVALLAPILMAVLLTQILDSPQKIKLVLIILAALGLVSAFQCTYQTTVENEAWIYRYENDPNSILGPLGVPPGTLNHMMLEHRILSEDVKGHFTTSNSAGSFTILALFSAAALFFAKLKSNPKNTRDITAAAIAAAAVLAGLLLTKSKGAILAAIIASIMFAAWLAFRKTLAAHKFKILIFCIIAAAALVAITVIYGLKHDRLPGGNSMLVRWQYWKSATQIYADHPLTGVGPGNFVIHYPLHKNPAALETVSDPHNFVLAVLAQYGPLGLAAFALLILSALMRPIFKTKTTETEQPPPTSPKATAAIAIIVALALLTIRPLIIPLSDPNDAGLAAYEIFISFITPVIAFALALWLLKPNANTTTDESLATMSAALFCGLTALLIHNLIDFAIFEPGVMTAFWAVTACLIALNTNHHPKTEKRLPAAPFFRLTTLAVVAISIWALFKFALLPVIHTTESSRIAMTRILQSHNLLDDAAELDPLDPAPLTLNARLYAERYEHTTPKQPILLERSVEALTKAAARNPADFKNYEKLCDVSAKLAEISTGTTSTIWLERALENATRAVECYPASGRLHYKLAATAEKLDKKQLALDHYKAAVEIEDAFRTHFRKMYPDWQQISRLGNKKYQTAKNKIAELSN